MKHFISFVAMVIATLLSASAKSITPAEAAATASDFFHTPISVRQLKAPQAQSALSPYYVFNQPEGGWVIVSGDDSMRRILAYGSGNFDPENAPEGAKELLDTYAKQYEIAASGSYFSPAYTDTGEEVLLETAQWDQSSKLTPIVDGYRTPVGCVPTAMGIICRYHEWPLRGQGSKSYTTETLGLEMGANFDTEYHISSLPLTPSYFNTWTEEQILDQNRLLLHLGIAAETNYKLGGSEANTYLACLALQEYFGYMPCAILDLRFTPVDEALEILKTDIDKSLPIMVSGANGSVGHAFVCDGYNSADMLHFNFGWGGYANGFYSIDDMGGYHYGPQFYCNLRPNYDFLTPESPDLSMEISYTYGPALGGLFPSVEYPISAGDHVYLQACQLVNLHPFMGQIAAVLCDEFGAVKTFLAKKNLEWTMTGCHSNSCRIDFIMPDKIKLNPTDRIYLYSSTDGTNWKRVHTHDGEREYVEIGMEAKPYIAYTSIGEHIEADTHELYDPDRNPYKGAVVSATLPKDNGSVARMIINGQRFYPDSVVGLTSYYTIEPASYYDPINIRIDSGSPAALITPYALKADRILTPGCTADVSISDLYYYYYAYTSIFNKENYLAIALCNASGEILQVYDPVDHRNEPRTWRGVQIPANTPSDAYLCLVSSANQTDWMEVYRINSSAYVRILLGHDTSDVKFTIRYLCEALTYTFYDETHYWGQEIEICNHFPYDPAYEFLGWEGLPEDMRMPRHNVDVYARIRYRNTGIHDITSDPAHEAVSGSYDLSGRKIDPADAPKGSVIISEGKKIVVGR